MYLIMVACKIFGRLEDGEPSRELAAAANAPQKGDLGNTISRRGRESNTGVPSEGHERTDDVIRPTQADDVGC
jgi:hypothetical protein